MTASAGNHVLKEADIRVLASNFKHLPSPDTKGSLVADI